MALSGFSMPMQNASFMGGQLGAPQMASTMSLGMPQAYPSMMPQQGVAQQQQQSPANIIQTMVVLLQAVIGLMVKLIQSAQGQQQYPQAGASCGQPTPSLCGGSPMPSMPSGGGCPQTMGYPQSQMPSSPMPQFTPSVSNPYASQPQYGGIPSVDPYGLSQPSYGAQPQYGGGYSTPISTPSFGAAPSYGALPQYGGGYSDPYGGGCPPNNPYPSPQTYPGWYYDVPSQHPPYDPNTGIYGPGTGYPGGQPPYGPFPQVEPPYPIGGPYPIDPGIGGEIPYPIDPGIGGEENPYPIDEPPVEDFGGLNVTGKDDDTAVEDDPFGDSAESDDPFGDTSVTDEFGDESIDDEWDTELDTDAENDVDEEDADDNTDDDSFDMP